MNIPRTTIIDFDSMEESLLEEDFEEDEDLDEEDLEDEEDFEDEEE